jgi:hypothetical protein
MADKQVVVFLKNGETIISETMEEGEAQAEFDRILEANPSTGIPRERLIKLGTSAAFQAGDFARIEIQEPPSFSVA